MRKDYEDEIVVVPNTGVFADEEVKRNEYFVSQGYLDKLGMRVCSVCRDPGTDLGGVNLPSDPGTIKVSDL